MMGRFAEAVNRLVESPAGNMITVTGELNGTWEGRGLKGHVARGDYRVERDQSADHVRLVPHEHRGGVMVVSEKDLKTARSLGFIQPIPEQRPVTVSDSHLAEAAKNLLHDDWLPETIEFRSGGPRVTLAYDRAHGSYVRASLRNVDCGTVADWQKAVKLFQRAALQFMSERGLQPHGEPTICGDEIVWQYTGSLKLVRPVRSGQVYTDDSLEDAARRIRARTPGYVYGR